VLVNRESLAKEFNDVSLEIKLLETRREGLRKQIQTIGSFTAGPYTVLVESQTRKTLAGIYQVAMVVGMETLEQAGLIKETTFNVIRVSINKGESK
jgi:hypothetical protein